MKSLPVCRPASVLCALVAAVLAASGFDTSAQAKPAKPAAKKPVAATKTAAKPGTPTKFDQHLAAHLKLFRVLSRYAETLAGAKDAATAHEAATKMDTITKEAITAGEDLVKLGKPSTEIEAKLAVNADLKMTAQTVAEQTRTAVKSLSDNAEVKTILAPAVENFQAALNRVQQAADEPAGLTEKAPPPATPPTQPGSESSPPPASETTAVPPPPQ